MASINALRRRLGLGGGSSAATRGTTNGQRTGLRFSPGAKIDTSQVDDRRVAPSESPMLSHAEGRADRYQGPAAGTGPRQPGDAGTWRPDPSESRRKAEADAKTRAPRPTGTVPVGLVSRSPVSREALTRRVQRRK